MTLAFTAGMTIVLVALGTFVYLRLRADLLDSIDFGLRSRAQVLADSVGRSAERAVVVAPGSLIDPDEAFAEVVDRSGAVLDSSPIIARKTLLTSAEVAFIGGPTFVTREVAGFDDPLRLLAAPVPSSAGRVVVVGTNLGDMNDALGSLFATLATLGPAAIALTALAGWLLAGAALRPVEQMRHEAAAISVSDLAHRLPDPGTSDELSRLAATLNSMLDRLQVTIERERRFVDDASHELRTPLATLRAEIDLALVRERDAAELQSALQSARSDVVRLQRLTEDLLVLARLRAGQVPLRRSEIALAELLRRGVGPAEPQAQSAAVAIERQASPDVVRVDPDRVAQAIRNLVENAIRQTPAGGSIAVSATHPDGSIRIAVRDPGAGFPADLLDRAFDPFTRAAGRDQDEGAGLGLTIVREIARAHGGEVVAENLDDGAMVTLILPD